MVGRVDALGPKKLARMSFSRPTTSYPERAKRRVDSEPIRPPEPVTITVEPMSLYTCVSPKALTIA